MRVLLQKPSWDSTTARTLRVIAYEVCGLLIAVLANPDAVELLKSYYPQVLVILTGFAPVATFIVNFIKKDVENY
jgi:ActR/RegA family two-component response regulator